MKKTRSFVYGHAAASTGPPSASIELSAAKKAVLVANKKAANEASESTATGTGA